jgi:hypothetical protein
MTRDFNPFGALAPRVHEILDRHRAEMAPVAEQEEDRIWKLALHRMDMRQYTVTEDIPEPPVAGEGQLPQEDGRHFARLDLKVPEPSPFKVIFPQLELITVPLRRVSYCGT